MTKLRVFLADDHEVVREGLKSLINTQADLEVVGEAGEGRTAVARIQDLRPDVAILDISLSDLHGAQVAEQLKQSCPEVKVLVLTVHEDKGHLRQLLKAGAAGYVLKLAKAEELLRAIRTVAAGQVYLDAYLAGKVVSGFIREPSREKPAGEGSLTEREAAVVRLVAQGYSNKEIAARLDISVKTVETHKYHAMEKLGVRGRAELVQDALRRGWLKPT
jgi:DNA-binding NarL/FixJ family response regulator